jgi:hypothetical protein
MLERIIKKMKPIYARRIEERLRRELLKDDAAMLRAHFESNYPWIKSAIYECQGKGFERSELADKIMARFLANVERSKTPLEIELAKKDKLSDT